MYNLFLAKELDNEKTKNTLKLIKNLIILVINIAIKIIFLFRVDCVTFLFIDEFFNLILQIIHENVSYCIIYILKQSNINLI